MNLNRALLRAGLSALAVIITLEMMAQQLSGTLPVGAASDGSVRLLVARGSKERLVDSARVGRDGRFAFTRRDLPTGFYRLSINDTDAVDLILDPRDTDVELAFNGTPLQRHIAVIRSDENKRLWEYKLVSREAQSIQAAVMREKGGLTADDPRRVLELDSIAARAVALQQAYLDGVVSAHPESYFARMIMADRGVDAARDQGPFAVMKVFDLSDPSLMRSAVYDKAVMTFLRNIHASSEEQFVYASDTLLAYAGKDAECRAYMLDHLIDLFSTYGPDMPLQYLIERYVVSPAGLGAIDPSLHAKVQEILKVGVGSDAPDVDLPGPRGAVPLRPIVQRNRYTVLFFYNSTCDHCHAEMPIVKELYTAYHPKGLEVIGIALDPDTTDFQRTIEEKGLPWDCYSEFNGWGSTVGKAFRVKATPWFYVLDNAMRIAAKPVDGAALGAWLEEHLK